MLQGSNETMFSSLVIELGFPNATLIDPNTVSGQLTVSTTGKVFGGTPLNLTGNISIVTDVPSVAFTSTRLAGNVPCSQVLVSMLPLFLEHVPARLRSSDLMRSLLKRGWLGLRNIG